MNQQLAQKDGEIKKDEYQPKYDLEFGLPDVPAKPKLFLEKNSKDDHVDANLYKYTYSSIEMAQELNGNHN